MTKMLWWSEDGRRHRLTLRVDGYRLNGRRMRRADVLQAIPMSCWQWTTRIHHLDLGQDWSDGVRTARACDAQTYGVEIGDRIQVCAQAAQWGPAESDRYVRTPYQQIIWDRS